MCPACLSTFIMIAAGAGTTGSLAMLAFRLRGRHSRPVTTSIPVQEQQP